MFGLPYKIGGWPYLYSKVTRQVISRGIATPSAIHRGLRRSRAAPEPSYGGRGRNSKSKEHESAKVAPFQKASKLSTGKREYETRPAASRSKAAGASLSVGTTGSQRSRRYESDRLEDGERTSRARSFMKAKEGNGGKSRSPRESGPRVDTPGQYGRDAEKRDLRHLRAPEVSSHRGHDAVNSDQYRADRRRAPVVSSSRDYEADDYTTKRRNNHSHRDYEADDFDKPNAYKRRNHEGPSDDKPFQKAKRAEPVAVTYTTPASEFLYGTSVVHAALKSSRRKHYKLYFSQDRTKTASNEEILKLAKKRGLDVQKVSSTALMDKMSGGRPHNGVLLEASPLMRPPVQSLHPVPTHGEKAIKYTAGKQSQEDLQINGTDNQFEAQARNRRYPLILLLDGVQDTGNMGGIIRTAHFLGVDAVIMSGTCAPLNAVVLKASAGAAETLPLLSVTDTSGFVTASQENGWNFIASVAPPSSSDKTTRRVSGTHYKTDDMDSPLRGAPCVLMIGGEGTGLMRDLVRKSDASVSIESHRARKSTVDSLNVSVATGILVDAFLRDVRTSPVLEEKDTKDDGAPQPGKRANDASGALF